MTQIQFTEALIIQLIKSGEKILLDIYTPSCSVCKTLDAQLALIENRTEVPIIKVNAEEMTSIAYNFSIMKVPQLILVNEGKEEKRHMGFLPSEAILDFIHNEN